MATYNSTHTGPQIDAFDTTTQNLNNLKVTKTGDTMTGHLHLKSTKATVGTAPSSNVYSPHLNFRDSSDASLGYIRSLYRTNDNTELQIEAMRNVGGTNYYNGIHFIINPSGQPSIYLSSPGGWRSALGLATATNSTITSIITVNSDNATITKASYATYDKIAQLYLQWKNVNAISVPASGNITNITIGTLVSGKRPAILTGGWSNGDNAGAAWYNISTGGSITLGACESTGAARTIAAGTAFSCYATYILA